MGNVSRFLKENMVKKENVFLPVSSDILDENGNVALWEIRHLSTEEFDKIKDECTKEVEVRTGKHKRTSMYRQQVDSTMFSKKLICASIVEPNLYDATIQDSFGVMTPEELITKLIPTPGEYNELLAFIQELNKFTETFEDKVEDVKNA